MRVRLSLDSLQVKGGGEMNNFIFNPGAFISNLKFMGIGMLGVLMIVAIIMLATYLINWTINNVSLSKNDENGDEE